MVLSPTKTRFGKVDEFGESSLPAVCHLCSHARAGGIIAGSISFDGGSNNQNCSLTGAFFFLMAEMDGITTGKNSDLRCQGFQIALSLVLL